MALAPIYTRVPVYEASLGPLRIKIWDISFVAAGTYVTGGFPIAAGDVGIGHNLLGAVWLQETAVAGAVDVVDATYNAATGNLRLIALSGAEVPNTTVMTSGVYRVMFIGF